MHTRPSDRILSRMLLLLRCGLWLVPVVYLVYSLVILTFVINHSYEGILQFYCRRWPNAFDVETVRRDCFTEAWYGWIKAHSGLLMGLIIGVLAVYMYFIRATLRFLMRLQGETGRVLRFLTAGWSSCSGGERAWVLVLFGGISAYWIYIFTHYPLYADEVCSYVYFVRHGFFFTIMSYPIPNNHVALNVVCCLLNRLPLLSPELVMRLPSMVGGMVLYYAIFCLVKRWGGFQRALVVVAGVVFCHMLSYYAVQGRGYQLQLVFVVVSGLGCWFCFFSDGRPERAGYALFIIAAALGFYVNPLLIYHFLALLLLSGYLFIKRKDAEGAVLFLQAFLIIAGLTLVLYLPLILANSWMAILGNKYVSPGKSWDYLVNKADLMAYALKYDFYYGTAGIYIAGAALLGSLFLYGKRVLRGRFYDAALIYFIASLLAITLMTLYRRVYPLERSLCFWVLVVNIIFVNVVYDVVMRYFPRGALVVLAVFLLVKIGGSVRLLYWDRFLLRNDTEVKIYHVMEKDFPQLVSLHPMNWQITVSEDYYSMYLRLYLMRHKLQERVVFSRTEALGDVLFLPDIYSPGFPLAGYVPWGRQRRTGLKGDYMTIYVKRGILGQ